MIFWHSEIPLLFSRLVDGIKFGAWMAANTCLWKLLRIPANISSHNKNFVPPISKV
jgi:hypothetical protein